MLAVNSINGMAGKSGPDYGKRKIILYEFKFQQNRQAKVKNGWHH